jgi:cytochrome c6
MTNKTRSLVVLAAVVILASSLSFAQSGAEATYKAKCQMCHGVNGAADTPTAKMMKVKPVSDPDMKKLSVAEMITATADGKGKMPAFKGKLSDAEIKDVVTYMHGLK